MNIKQQHEQMVAALKKPGQDILDSLTPEKCDLLHMAVGVAGEGGEFLSCILNFVKKPDHFDRENAVEELGDLEYYLQGVAEILNIGYQMPEKHLAPKVSLLSASTLTVATSDLLDAVKKHIIYNRPLRDTSIPIDFSGVIDALSVVYTELGISREEVLQHNLNKLLTGEKARYKLGQYTDQQAQNRADKQA